MTTTTCWYVDGAVAPWHGTSAVAVGPVVAVDVVAVDVVAVDVVLVDVVDARRGTRAARE